MSLTRKDNNKVTTKDSNKKHSDPFWSLLRSPFHSHDLFGESFFHDMEVDFTSMKDMPETPKLDLDLTEEGDKWVVHADLPGYKEEDVELNIKNGMLGVRAKREKVVENKTSKSHRVERSFGEVRRTVLMPKGADLDNAHASLENGVLSVSFPKLQLEDGARGTRIPITSSSSSSSSKQ